MNRNTIAIAGLVLILFVFGFAILSGKPNTTPTQLPETGRGGSAPLANEGKPK